MRLVDSSDAEAAELVAIRRDIHAHPELAFEERRTAALVVDFLSKSGIEVHRGIGGTGVVGVLRAGTSSKAIGLRADMDALPITESNEFAHASRHPGQMHACGHDGHTTMLLAAARELSRTRRFDGIVYFVFQPAEEGDGGARRMIEDGLFDRFPMESIFAAHNWPGLPVGQFVVNPGPMMAAIDVFTIVVRGHGGHAALPHLSRDPVPAAAMIALGLQTVVSRNIPASESAVLSVTNIHAGDTVHVIPDEATISGSVRTYSEETTNLIECRVRELATQIAAASGLSVDVQYERVCPPTINSVAEADAVRRVLIDLCGETAVQPMKPPMTAEDFAAFLRVKPGAYFLIGNGDGGHRDIGHALGPCTLHSSSYDFNDQLIPLGASIWLALVEHLLASKR
jgi:amidohydrolase